MTWVTDLSHFDGVETAGPAGRLAAFLGAIVSAASASPPDRWKLSAVRCRRRPERQPCPGRICLREGSDGTVEWICPMCEDNGYIRNWKGSPYDLSRMRDRESGPHFEIVLTEQEYDEVKKCLVLDLESERVVTGATFTAEGIVLRATGDDLDNLAGHLAFEANHEEKRKRQRVLDGVLSRIDILLVAWNPN